MTEQVPPQPSFDPEATDNHEFATQADLEAVYLAGAEWLLQHTPPILPEEAIVHGVYEGLPIYSNGMLSYEVSVPGSAVQAAAPQAGAHLQVYGSLTLSFEDAYYVPIRDSPENALAYEEPALFVTIERNRAAVAGYNVERFSIFNHPAEQGYSTDRWLSELQTADGDPVVEPQDEETFAAGFVAGIDLEVDTGMDQLTVGECRALVDIIARLDEIVQRAD